MRSAPHSGFSRCNRAIHSRDSRSTTARSGLPAPVGAGGTVPEPLKIRLPSHSAAIVPTSVCEKSLPLYSKGSPSVLASA